MAISLDATSGPIASTASSWSHTCSTSAGRKLFVAFSGNVSGTDNITAVTYAGVSLTKVATVQKPSDRLVDLWYLDNPASGTNTVSVTASGFYAGMSVSYTGCATGIDSQNTATASAAASLTVSTTVVATSAWLVGVIGNNNGAQSAGTGTTVRVDDSANASGMFDSNGNVDTGSRSLQVTRSGSNNWAGIVVSIAPFVPTPKIAFDTSNNQKTTTITNTLSITPSAAADLLIAFAFVNNPQTSVGMTWNGVALNNIASVPAASGIGRAYCYALSAPATGTHNLVSTISAASSGHYLMGMFYSGTKQSGNLDVSVTSAPVGSLTQLTQTLTTLADDAWTACISVNDQGSLAASTNSTLRGTTMDAAVGAFDSNGVVTPTGSFNMTQTGGNSNGRVGIMVSIRPALGAGINVDSAVLSQANATTSNTWSHTTSGTNRLLIVGVQFATGTDISGVPTYNGTSMSLVASNSIGGTVFNKCYVYSLANPTIGANNVVVNNTGGANYIYAASVSYTGVDQVTPIDVSSTATSTATSLSKSVTTTVNNDWLVGYFSGGTLGSTFTAGTSTTLRTSGSAAWNVMTDSNSAQTPAGSFSLAVNASGAEHLGAIVLAIKAVSTTITKNLTESITHSDTFIRSAGRTFSEAITNTDTFLRTIGRVFSEAISHLATLPLTSVFFPMQSVTDDFAGTTINSSKWNQFIQTGTSIAQNNEIELTTSTTTANTAELYGAFYYNLLGSSASMKLIDSGNLAIVSYYAVPLGIQTATSGVYTGFYLHGGTLYTVNNGSFVGTLTFNAATMKWFRIRESAGTIYTDYSADAITWTNTYSTATTNDYTKAYAYTQVYTTVIEATATTLKVGLYNILGTAYTTALSEAILNSDTFSKLHTFGSSLTESITNTDTLIKKLIRSLVEAISHSDTFSGFRNIAKQLTEAVSHTDQFIRLVTRVLRESFVHADTLVRTVARNFIESITNSDTFTGTKVTLKQLTESITNSDVFAAAKATVKSFTESISNTDVFARLATLYRVYTETITNSDTLSNFQSKLLTLPEAISHLDKILKTSSRTLIEAITNSDTFSTIRNFVRTYTESITNTASLVKTSLKSLVETITNTDAYSRVVTWLLVFTEATSLTAKIHITVNGFEVIWSHISKPIESAYSHSAKSADAAWTHLSESIASVWTHINRS